VGCLLTVVIPSHKEGAVVSETVARVLDLFSESPGDLAIHVMLDGTDPVAVKSLNNVNSQSIKVTELSENHGKGYCLRVGARASDSKYVVFLDADLDIDPGSILLGLEILEKCEDGSIGSIGCVYGSKFHPSSTLSYPPLRKIASKVFKIAVQILFGLNVDDSQTGLKLFRNSDLQRVINDTREDRFLFDLELMILLKREGVKMSPIPVNLNYKYSSTISFKSVIVLGAQTAGLFFRQSLKRK
jgi:glycosyltransferase involved in cell wall biosynthesis